MKLVRKAGATSNIFQIFVRDSSSTTGGGLTGLVFNTASLTAYYHRDTDTTATAITLVTMTVGTFTSSGFKEIDATNMPGWYQFCPPDAAIAASAKNCGFHLKGAANMAPLPFEVQLVAYDPDDSVRLGLTALPNAAAAASGGLPILGTNATAISFTAGVTISSTTGDALTLSSSGGNGNGVTVAGNGSGQGIKLTPGATGHGLYVLGGATSGSAARFEGVITPAQGIHVLGAGTGPGLQVDGGATGPGIKVNGGATSGDGIDIATTSGDGLSILPTAGSAIVATGNGTSKHGAVITGGTAGTSDGLKVVAGTGGVPIRGDITGNITGNLSGSAGSVSGAVGSVTGNVGGNVTGSVGSVVATVAANLTQILGTALTETAGQLAAAFKQFFNIASPTSTMNLITAVTTVTTTTTATNLTNAPTSGDFTATMKTSLNAATPTASLSTLDTLVLQSGTAQAGAASTITLAAGASATDNLYRGLEITVYGGTGAGQSRVITGYVGSTKVATVDEAWITNPDNTSLYKVLEIRAAKLDSSQQVTAASVQGNVTGSVASVAGAVGSVTGNVGGNVVGTVASVVGAVGSVTGNVGGNVVGSVASVTARVTANTDQLAGQTVTAAAGVTFPASVASPTNITAGTITTATNLTNAPTSGDFTATMKTSLNAATPSVTVSDKTGFSLSAGGVQAIWDALTSALTTVGSIGKLLVDNINATISSRFATSAAPANFSALGITAGGKISGVVLADTVTTYTGNTPQTGDSFVRLGAPAGASVSADIAATSGNTWDVTLASHVTAGSTGFALNAAGSAGDPWGTALPGAYGAGTAGNIVGNNLNATVSSRLPTASITLSAGAVTVGTNNDKTGYALTSAYDPAKTAAQAGDAMALTSGERTTLAGVIWANASRTLTSFGTLVADVATAVWGAGTRTLSAFGFTVTTDVSSTVTTNLDTTVSSRLATSGYTVPPTAIENADGLLKRDMAAVTGEAARSLLNAIRFLRNKWSLSGSTLTVTKENDTTTAWTATVGTTVGADPITSTDPI